MEKTIAYIFLCVLLILSVGAIAPQFGHLWKIVATGVCLGVGYKWGKTFRRRSGSEAAVESSSSDVEKESESAPALEPESEPSLELIRGSNKRCELSFIKKILVSGKFKASFEVVEETSTTPSSLLYKARHIIEARHYLVRKVIFSLVDGVIPDDKIFRQVDSMIKLNSKYLLRYVTSWFEAELENEEDTLNENSQIALYIQSEASEGISLRDLLNVR
jgi:hypothetical protein